MTIGGANATVAYAGPIVGSILGLVQINCVVPTGATTGKAVPVLVRIWKYIDADRRHSIHSSLAVARGSWLTASDHLKEFFAQLRRSFVVPA